MSNLKNIRKSRKLTQAELADKSGMDIRSIQMWEQGHRHFDNASIRSVLRIAAALECEISELFDNDLKDIYLKYKRAIL